MGGFALAAPMPRGPMGAALLRLDARPKILFAVAVGLFMWRLPVPGLCVLGAAMLLACHALGGLTGPGRRLWLGYLLFVLPWAAIKAGLDLLAGHPPDAALLAGGEMGLRLGVLLALGLALALAASARSLGVALAWYLRPVLGRRSFEAALAVALMLHFIPLALQSAADLSRALTLRWPGCPWRERAVLVPLALVRVLSRATWTQALAVAARGLDDPAAWRPARRVRAAEWLAALLPAAAMAASVWL
ncbi:hypothetical protein dsx2_0781 [Desulfovibrio sp. X2]|uniref:hypothetical protein n=1 Tax=Desulfovibrio sp. X2 TaxID=941449 RepID=UPI0003586D93|nr:hypothetical protein [Desulfovibrio sp. X2]EPR37435.1 hypothetical protein dsx2_0781 [Desulfovibrio sp. X2]